MSTTLQTISFPLFLQDEYFETEVEGMVWTAQIYGKPGKERRQKIDSVIFWSGRDQRGNTSQKGKDVQR